MADEAAVFRIAILGRSKSGKTTMASQLVSHSVINAYVHTEVPTIYMTCIQSGERGNRRAMKSPSRSFGVQIEDTPGTDSDRLSSYETHVCISSRESNPQNSPLDSLFDSSDATPLLDAYNRMDKTNPNAIMRAQRTVAFVVVFDLTDVASYRKAVRMIETILHDGRSIHRQSLRSPIALIGNKKDLLAPQKESALFRKRDLEREARIFASRKQRVFAFSGSVARNQLQELNGDSGRAPMQLACEDVIAMLVANLNESAPPSHQEVIYSYFRGPEEHVAFSFPREKETEKQDGLSPIISRNNDRLEDAKEPVQSRNILCSCCLSFCDC